MIDWLTVGGGICGAHLVVCLHVEAGLPGEAIGIVDPAGERLERPDRAEAIGARHVFRTAFVLQAREGARRVAVPGGGNPCGAARARARRCLWRDSAAISRVARDAAPRSGSRYKAPACADSARPSPSPCSPA